MSLFKRLAGAIAVAAAILMIAAPATAAPATQGVPCTSTEFAQIDAFAGHFCYAYAGNINVDEQVWTFDSGNNAGYFVFDAPLNSCIHCTQPFHKYQHFYFQNSVHIWTLHIN
ncbi:hypothetical protein GCM10009765_43030 [Fodinicola feengrottensis]|uniref:Uncharacterized protein n=1 Tax=Fodinicola feengrottensis TaxID=435914 RepID=A0ABN2HKL5_9ACTN